MTLLWWSTLSRITRVKSNLRFENSFIVDSCIDNVWSFYTDIMHLERITPPQLHLKVLATTSPQLLAGSLITLSGKFLFIKKTWKSQITYSQKYKYVDEMIHGPFRQWRHTHIFVKLDSHRTIINDEIDFNLPFYLDSRLLNSYMLRSLKRIFDFRKNQTIEFLVEKRHNNNNKVL